MARIISGKRVCIARIVLEEREHKGCIYSSKDCCIKGIIIPQFFQKPEKPPLTIREAALASVYS